MKCTNPNETLTPKCDGEFKKAIKPGHIECVKCGYRVKGKLQADAPEAPVTTKKNKEN